MVCAASVPEVKSFDFPCFDLGLKVGFRVAHRDESRGLGQQAQVGIIAFGAVGGKLILRCSKFCRHVLWPERPQQSPLSTEHLLGILPFTLCTTYLRNALESEWPDGSHDDTCTEASLVLAALQ